MIRALFLALIIALPILFSCQQNNAREKLVTEDLKHLLEKSDQLYQKNNHAKAIACFDKIIEIDSTIGEVYYRRGYCEAQSFEYTNSTKDYKKSIELNHRIEDSYFTESSKQKS